jgi:chromosomal replication initiation ATPase DnaA
MEVAMTAMNTDDLQRLLMSINQASLELEQYRVSIKRVLRQKYRRMPRKVLEVARRLADEAGIPRASILGGHSQQATYVTARRQLACELRKMGYSYPEIGLWMGLHHATVMYHVRKGNAA